MSYMSWGHLGIIGPTLGNVPPPHSNKIFRPNRIITWELGTRKGLSFLFLSFDFYSIVPKVGIAFYSIRRAEQVKSRMCHRFFFLDICKNGVPHNHHEKFTSAHGYVFVVVDVARVHPLILQSPDGRRI